MVHNERTQNPFNIWFQEVNDQNTNISFNDSLMSFHPSHHSEGREVTGSSSVCLPPGLSTFADAKGPKHHLILRHPQALLLYFYYSLNLPTGNADSECHSLNPSLAFRSSAHLLGPSFSHHQLTRVLIRNTPGTVYNVTFHI